MKNSTSNEKVYRVRLYYWNNALHSLAMGFNNGCLHEITGDFSTRSEAMNAVRLFKKSKKKWPFNWGTEGPTLIRLDES